MYILEIIENYSILKYGVRPPVVDFINGNPGNTIEQVPVMDQITAGMSGGRESGVKRTACCGPSE